MRKILLARPLAGVTLLAALYGGSAYAADKLTVWHYFAVDTQVAVLKENDKAFADANPGVDVEAVYVPYDQMDQKLIGASAAGTGPDVIVAQAGGSEQLADAGAIADMTPCIATWTGKDELLPAAIRKNVDRIDGVLPYGNLVVLWYNKDILDKYKLKPPGTIDELEADLKAVTAGGDGGLLMDGNPSFTSTWSAEGLFTALGVTYPNVDVPATAPAFARLATWVAQGWVPRDVSSMDQPTAMNRFLTGKFAFTINGNWEIAHVKNDAKFAYGVTAMPSGTAPAVVYISGETAMLGAHSAHPDLACKYLNETWFSKDGQMRSLKGIGSLPILRSMQNLPDVTADPIVSVFAKQASTALPVAGGAQYVANNTAWGPAISTLWSGNADPAQLSAKAITDVKAALSAPQ